MRTQRSFQSKRNCSSNPPRRREASCFRGPSLPTGPVRPPIERVEISARSGKVRKQVSTRSIAVLLAVSLLGAALPALGQSAGDLGKEVRILGCVQWEKDYRKERNEGRGGALGTGLGVGNEFVLTMVKPEGG